VVEQVIGLARHLADAVRIGRAERMAFIDRQPVGAAINLARAGEDDRGARRVDAAQLEQAELGAAVDVEIGEGVRDRVHVARPRREVEEIIAAVEQRRQSARIAQIRDLDPDAVANRRDIGPIGAALGVEVVEQRDLRAQLDEPRGEARADEAEPARHQHPRAGEGGPHVLVLRHRAILADGRMKRNRETICAGRGPVILSLA